MHIQGVEHRVEQAVLHESATNVALKAVRRFFASIGRPLSSDEAQRAIRWITAYVQHVPFVLRQVAEEAHRRRVAAFDEILAAACAYWHAGALARRASHGLMSVTDDAYGVLSVLQGVSQRLRDETGIPLVDVDLASANAIMRRLIGEPFATRLDHFVAEQIGVVATSRMFADVAQALRECGPVLIKDCDPIWSAATWNEPACAQACALGMA